MARRPAAKNTPPDFPLTLQKAFDACQVTETDPETGAVVNAEQPPEAAVGQRLRALRLQKNLSVRALAARSGLAINTLSMIENGKTSPSVSTLQILARALEMPIAAFFEQETIRKKVVHVRSQQRPSVMVETTRLEHLGKDLAESAVQPFVVTLEPGSGSGQNLIVHTGHEFVYCLRGQVEYFIEDDTYVLASGDSLVFESHLPHRWQNSSDAPSQVILVLIPSDMRDTPAERHFPLEDPNLRRRNMKIALITDDGKTISQHFGRAPFYLVLTIEEGKITNREMRDKMGHNQFSTQPHTEEPNATGHGLDSASHDKHLSMAEAIADCKVLLCGGMGRGAYESMRRLNIQPVVTDLRDIEMAAQAFIDGKLVDHTELLH